MESNARPGSGAPAVPGATGVVLAGGRASRMGGVDKGLVALGGRPMIEYVIEALRPQVGALLVNANRNQRAYERFGCPVISDDVTGFAGPLAGMARALAVIETPLLVTAPCDSPLIGADFVARLAAHLAGAEVAVAHDGERLQPVFAMLRRSVLPDLLAYLESGERKIDRWYARRRLVEVDFSDRATMFANINTAEQRAALEQRLLAGTPC